MYSIATNCNNCIHSYVCKYKEEFNKAQDSAKNSYYSGEDKRVGYIRDSKVMKITLSCEEWREDNEKR